MKPSDIPDDPKAAYPEEWMGWRDVLGSTECCDICGGEWHEVYCPDCARKLKQELLKRAIKGDPRPSRASADLRERELARALDLFTTKPSRKKGKRND